MIYLDTRGENNMSDRTVFILMNCAYIFAKFFFILIWIYATWVIICGGEIKLSIGDNSIRLGFEGIIPTIKNYINLTR